MNLSIAQIIVSAVVLGFGCFILGIAVMAILQINRERNTPKKCLLACSDLDCTGCNHEVVR